jgi:hypothetical protein
MNEEQTTADAAVDVAALVARLKADRLVRRLSWVKYAKLLEVPTTTLIKLVSGQTSKPHETTSHWLNKKLDDLAAAPVPAAEPSPEASDNATK